MRNVLEESCREYHNTRLPPTTPQPLSPENRAVYKIMWKNFVEQDRTQMAIWRIRIACSTLKAAKTRSEYVILIAFPLQQWLYERVSVLRHTYSTCLADSEFYI